MSDKISIIIPSDFTDVSAVAIKNALALKKSSPLNLTIFHVVNNLVLDNIKHNRTSMDNITMKLGQTEDELRSIPDLSVITKISEGSIFHSISREAAEQKADFVFLGSHGVKSVQHIVGGFISLIIQKLNCGVMVSQSKAVGPEGFKKIFVLVDSWDRINKYADLVTKLAKIAGSEIYLQPFSYTNPILNHQVHSHTSAVSQVFSGAGIPCTVAPNPVSNLDDAIDNAVKYGADVIATNMEENRKIILGDDQSDLLNNPHQVPVYCINNYTESMIDSIGNVYPFNYI